MCMCNCVLYNSQINVFPFSQDVKLEKFRSSVLLISYQCLYTGSTF